MKREERQSLLQRCIKWREANIKEKQFILWSGSSLRLPLYF